MTDPNTPTQPTNNPQDLIDQALGGTATPVVTPDPSPTLPVPEALTPPAAVTEEAPMSTESVLPPTETVPTELTAKPEVAPAMSEPPVDTKPMGEDMPLAFAAGLANQVNEPTITPVAPLDMSSATSIVPPAITQPNTDSKSIDKSKSRLASVKTVLVAVLAFVGVMSAAGYWAYNKYGTVSPATIAAVKGNDEASCNGCVNGGWMVWRNNECKITGVCGNTNNPTKNTDNPMEVTEKPANSCNSSNASTCCGAGYQFCGGAIGKCVSNTALNGKGCNGYGLEVYGIPTTYGSSASKSSCDATKVQSGLQTQCNCGSGNVCFERRGDCFLGAGDGSTTADYVSNTDNNPNNDNPNIIKRSDGSYVNMGLCGLVSSYKPTTNTTGLITENTKFFENAECFECDENGCKIKSGLTGDAATKCYGPKGCTTVRYTCDETKGGISCLENQELLGNDAAFKGKCGTVEQIDVSCGGQYIASRTRINPECVVAENTPNPSPSVTPTLMCSSLTKTPTTTPEVGDKVTFTCVGASTPAGAVSLTYKFRYSLNSGAYVAMTNKTATTSELTIASCGSYKVQCQACGTINGVLTCDPNWTAATQ